ncbi:porin [Rhodobacteraceae bacterium SC52]|nr:porin [Rhodobacteraceae bacterium SC52]
MKKILLASTALIASAGFASAEVVIGGDGYMGVAYGSNGDPIFATTDKSADELPAGSGDHFSNYGFVYDLDVDFKVSGTSDSGLTFGASGDFDDLGKSQGARGWDNSIFISGDFGTLTMGDVSAGAENVIGDLAGVGLSGLGDFNENIFLLGAGAQPAGPVARYDYAISGLTLSLGLTDDAGYNIGAGYATDLFSVGAAYESVADGAVVTIFDIDALGSTGSTQLTAVAPDGASQVIGAASVTFANVTLKGTYGRIDVDGTGVDTVDQYGVSAAAAFGAASVSAYYRQIDVDYKSTSTTLDNTIDAYGLGVAYDLGGGLALEAGVAQADADYTLGTNTKNKDALVVADFGVSIDF